MIRQYLLLIAVIAAICFVFSANAQSLPFYVPSSGLIAWWPFNGNANDESGNDNNGTNNGAILTTDRFGFAERAYLFDGTSSFISIPTSSSLESPASEVTFSAWVNMAGFSLVGQPFDPILTKSNSNANAFMYRFTIDINGTGYYAGTNDWTTNIGALHSFLLNEWYMLTAALASDSAYFYVNDSLIASYPFTTNIQNNTLPLEIGRDVPGITEVFNGKIDDIGIWNRALTPQEIASLYAGSSSGLKEPLGGYAFSIYPNPVNDKISIVQDEGKAESDFIVSDVLGEIKLKGKINSKNMSIDMHNLSPGIYILRIDCDKRITYKIVKD